MGFESHLKSKLEEIGLYLDNEREAAYDSDKSVLLVYSKRLRLKALNFLKKSKEFNPVLKGKYIYFRSMRERNASCDEYQRNSARYGQANGYRMCSNCGHYHIY